jgi:hypothetical protein
MPFPIINFGPETSKKTRKVTLINLRKWITSDQSSPFKKELLEAVINFAEQRFVNFRLKPTNQNRMTICENIFKLANQSDEFFLRGVLQQINNITELKSELRNTLLIIHSKYSAHIQNVELSNVSSHSMASSVSSSRMSASHDSPRSIASVNPLFVPQVSAPLNNEPLAHENSQALVVAPHVSRPLQEAASLVRRNSQALVVAALADQNQRQPYLDRGLFNNLMEAGNRMLTSSSVIRCLLPEPIPIQDMPHAPVANLDHIIKAFQDETARLKQRDFSMIIVTYAVYMAIGLSLKHLNIIEDRATRICTQLAICFGINYLLSWNRSELLSSQQRKLTYLFNEYKRLTGRSPANTNTPQVIKIFRAIAPYLQNEELSPWANAHSDLYARFGGTSHAFREILEQSPHGIFIENGQLRIPSVSHLAAAAIFGMNAAIDMYTDELKAESEERLNRRTNKYNLFDIPAFKNRILYGKSSLPVNAEDEIANPQLARR